MTRILITGGRRYADRGQVYAALDHVHANRRISVVIHGACHLGGADLLAKQWAEKNGVPDEPYPVDHTKDGMWPGAGPKRNRRMLRESRPDGVVAFPGGDGTADMKRAAAEVGLRIWEPYGAGRHKPHPGLRREG